MNNQTAPYQVDSIKKEITEEIIEIVSKAINLFWYKKQLLSIGAVDDNLQVECNKDAAVHYLSVGARDGLDPHPMFSTKFYELDNPDVFASPFNPFVHYLLFGNNEKRQHHPLISESLDIINFNTDHLKYKIHSTDLFDGQSYLLLYRDVVVSGLDPLYHYLEFGVLEGRSPHHAFDTTYYRQQLDQNHGIHDLYIDYLYRGWSLNLNPHILFDTEFARYFGHYNSNDNPYIQFMLKPWSGKAIHALFDINFYKEQNPDRAMAHKNPLISYLISAELKMSTHVLFDANFYQDQITDEINDHLLIHYLSQGWKNNLNPHILFHQSSYVDSVYRGISSYKDSPIIDYIKNPLIGNPHYLFDTNFYINSESIDRTVNPLMHYIQKTKSENFYVPSKTHVLFDSQQYIQEASKFCIIAWKMFDDLNLKEILEIFKDDNVRRSPLEHYLMHGWKYDITPNLMFDVSYYKEQVKSLVQEPIYHYLISKGYKLYSPNKGLLLEYFLKTNLLYDIAVQSPLEYLLKQNYIESDIHPYFDKKFYIELYEDIRIYNIDPTKHFLEFGVKEGRFPNKLYSEKYVWNKYVDESFCNESGVSIYLTKDFHKPKVIFVSHDASRTGAPLIILKIIQFLSNIIDCEFYTILGRGGPLVEDFSRVSHTIIMQHGLDARFLDTSEEHDPNWYKEAQNILKLIDKNKIMFCIVNTAEARSFSNYFFTNKLPVIALVHEAADPYQPEQFATIFKAATSVIFPSKFTTIKAITRVGYEPDRWKLRGQGLLNDFLLKCNKKSLRASVRRQLGIPEDGIVVFGCGTVDWRKGVDIFAEVASRTIALQASDEIYFVWVGAGSYGYDSARYWAETRLKADKISDRFKFIEAQEDTTGFYIASDIMLVTSRMDPFPCVTHEGMAAGLPIVAFEGWSGAPEAFLDAGLVVPAGDVNAMVDGVLKLINEPKIRYELGARAIEIVSNKWKFDLYVDDIINEIEDVTSSKIPKFIKHSKNNRGLIYFMQPDWGISGVNTFTVHLVNELRGMGFDAKILFTRGRFTELRSKFLPNNYVEASAIEYIQPASSAPDAIWREVLRKLHENRPCIVVPNYDYVASAVSPIVPDGVAIVGIAHSDDVEHYEHVYRLGLYWDHIIAVSKKIEEQINVINPGFSSRTSTIYYGVPFSEDYSSKVVERRFGAIDKENISNRPIKLVYSGRMTQHQKKVRNFVELVNRLHDNKIPFHLTMIGEGDELEFLKRKMKIFVDKNIVSLPGRMNARDLMFELEKSDLFVLLSDFEGLPLSMLEAMALGVIPVVRDMDSGVKEVIEHGFDGYICSRSNMDDMVNIIKDLQKDLDKRKLLSQNTVESFIRHGLGKTHMATAYAKLFDDIFAIMPNRLPKPEPMAYNAPMRGIQAPPFLQWKP